MEKTNINIQKWIEIDFYRELVQSSQYRRHVNSALSEYTSVSILDQLKRLIRAAW